MMVRCSSRATSYTSHIKLPLHSCKIINICSHIKAINIWHSSSSLSAHPCVELDIENAGAMTTTTTTTTITTTTTTTTTINNNYPEAELPSNYNDMKQMIMDKKCDELHICKEMIAFYKKCIENKIINWRNNSNLVHHCFALHELFWQNGGGIITNEYISLLTHILSNSSGNKQRIDYLILNLNEKGMINALTLETLITSCYNEYTGDAFLAYHIYRKFRAYRVKPTTNIINELFISCMKRGVIDTAFQIYFELKNDKIQIENQPLRKLYDICVLKHSLSYADLLTKDLIDIKYEDKSFVVNNYLKICGASGNLLKALEALHQFERRAHIEIDLHSVSLLIRTLITNAQIYTIDKKQWRNVLHSNYRTEKIESNKINNPKWTEILRTSSDIVALFKKYQALFDSNTNNEYVAKIFDNIAFFASMFVENKREFYHIYKYIYNQKGKYLRDPSIVGHLLRGFRRHKLFKESMVLWQIYRATTSDNDANNKLVHPYAEMLKICSYNMIRDEFRIFGSEICHNLAVKYDYFGSQKLFDAALNFWSGNDVTRCMFLDTQETKAIHKNEFIRTTQTYCALLRCAMKNNDFERSLKFMQEIEENLNDDEQDDHAEGLLRMRFHSYFHFKLRDKSLQLLRDCIHSKKSRHSIQNGVFSVIKTFISCKKYAEILDIMLSIESDIFHECWMQNRRLITKDDITLLMYCCYKTTNLDVALDLFEISMARNVAQHTSVTYTYFIQLLIDRFGAFSDTVIDTVSQLMDDNIIYADAYDVKKEKCQIINIHQMSAQK